MLDMTQLTDAFVAAGLDQGDTALVHSSLRQLGPVEGGANGVIDALLAAVGPRGTIAVPTHTWDTVIERQPLFHETLTPSIVGALTNVLRGRPGAVRSLHPTHSMAALGARACEFTHGHEKDDTPCSPAGPYGRLAEWGGKVFIIGKGLECCTFFHCVEEMAGCGTWSLAEEYQQLYVLTADGRTLSTPQHRHRNGVSDNYPRLEGYLVSLGLLRLSYVDGCKLYCLNARGSAEWLTARLRENTKWLW